MAFDPPAKNEVRRCLLETTSWCLAKHPIRDPQGDLRTPDLEPAIEDWPTFAELDEAVSVLATTRREELTAGYSRDVKLGPEAFHGIVPPPPQPTGFAGG